MSKRSACIDAYNKYYGLVCSEFYSKLSNIDLAEDLSQEVFITMFEKFETIENVRTWLYGAIKNKIRNYVKKNKIDAVDIDDVFYDDGLAFINGMQDTRIIIEQALQNIEAASDLELLVFDMIAKQNRGLTETARSLNISQRKVRYAFAQIKRKLLDELNKNGIKSIEALL